VSTTGLEFAYAEAPASMKAVIMSLFLLTTTVGDLLTGVVYSAGAKLSKVGSVFKSEASPGAPPPLLSLGTHS
jgi:dipeptide/tripeptide permease